MIATFGQRFCLIEQCLLHEFLTKDFSETLTVSKFEEKYDIQEMLKRKKDNTNVGRQKVYSPSKKIEDVE